MKKTSAFSQCLLRLGIGGVAAGSLYCASVALGPLFNSAGTRGKSTVPTMAMLSSGQQTTPAAGAAKLSGPVLSILNGDIHLDGTAHRAPQEVEVVMRNDGSAALTLNSISLDAGCEITHFPDKALSPGESATIGLRITPAETSAKPIRTLNLHSNASAEPAMITVRTVAAR